MKIIDSFNHSKYKVHKSFAYFLFVITIIELVLCGSGQILKIGGQLTLRMILFSLSILSYFFYYFNKFHKLDRNDAVTYFLFIFTFSISIGIGLLNGDVEKVLLDIKPLSFFLLFPLWAIIFKEFNCIPAIKKIICYGSLLMSILYLIYLIAMKVTGIMEFGAVYSDMTEESDFMFRGNSGEFFYKGFIFIPIGVIFWLYEKKYVPVIINVIAIYFTLTRGFYIITIVGVILYYIQSSKLTKSKIIYLSLAFIIGSCVMLLFYDALFNMRDDTQGGDMIRLLTITQVIDDVNFTSFIFGHGLGYGVPIRPIHMENSFLEIFHKQGVIGLTVWFVLLCYIWKYYKKVPNKYKMLASVFFSSAIMIYIQSLFNPYITNPMGIGIVLLSYFSCKKLCPN